MYTIWSRVEFIYILLQDSNWVAVYRTFLTYARDCWHSIVPVSTSREKMTNKFVDLMTSHILTCTWHQLTYLLLAQDVMYTVARDINVLFIANYTVFIPCWLRKLIMIVNINKRQNNLLYNLCIILRMLMIQCIPLLNVKEDVWC